MNKPPDFEYLQDKKAMKSLLLPMVMCDLEVVRNNIHIFRAMWRRLFLKDVPPWLDKATVCSPGPYAIPSMLVGELCAVCERPLYMAQGGITCAGGHGEKRQKKVIKELLDGGDGSIVSPGFADAAAGGGIDDDDDGFFD